MGYEERCVGLIYEQFAGELAAWQQKYAGRPRDELIGLCRDRSGCLSVLR
jgi:hypothetical protein